MSHVPETVKSALARNSMGRAPAAPWPASSNPVSAGDLRIIEPLPHCQSDRRIGLVQQVHPVDDFAEVLLVHSAPEMATDRDLVATGPALVVQGIRRCCSESSGG